MATNLEDIKTSLFHWNRYLIAENLFGENPSPEYQEPLTELGRLLTKIINNRSQPEEIVVDPDNDPLENLKEILKPTLRRGDYQFPDAAVELLLAGANDVEAEVEKADDEKEPREPTENGTPEDDEKPPPEEREEEITEWVCVLYLTKITCVKETSPAVLTDDFLLFGRWTYDDQNGEIQAVRGQFDTGIVINYARDIDPPHGVKLAKIDVVRSQGYRPFRSNIACFEEDGMNAEDAKLLASILGVLATLGVNAFLSSTPVAGVTIPAGAKTGL